MCVKGGRRCPSSQCPANKKVYAVRKNNRQYRRDLAAVVRKSGDADLAKKIIRTRFSAMPEITEALGLEAKQVSSAHMPGKVKHHKITDDDRAIIGKVKKVAKAAGDVTTIPATGARTSTSGSTRQDSARAVYTARGEMDRLIEEAGKAQERGKFDEAKALIARVDTASAQLTAEVRSGRSASEVDAMRMRSDSRYFLDNADVVRDMPSADLATAWDAFSGDTDDDRAARALLQDEAQLRSTESSDRASKMLSDGTVASLLSDAALAHRLKTTDPDHPDREALEEMQAIYAYRDGAGDKNRAGEGEDSHSSSAHGEQPGEDTDAITVTVDGKTYRVSGTTITGPTGRNVNPEGQLGKRVLAAAGLTADESAQDSSALAALRARLDGGEGQDTADDDGEDESFDDYTARISREDGEGLLDQQTQDEVLKDTLGMEDYLPENVDELDSSEQQQAYASAAEGLSARADQLRAAAENLHDGEELLCFSHIDGEQSPEPTKISKTAAIERAQEMDDLAKEMRTESEHISDDDLFNHWGISGIESAGKAFDTLGVPCTGTYDDARRVADSFVTDQTLLPDLEPKNPPKSLSKVGTASERVANAYEEYALAGEAILDLAEAADRAGLDDDAKALREQAWTVMSRTGIRPSPGNGKDADVQKDLIGEVALGLRIDTTSISTDPLALPDERDWNALRSVSAPLFDKTRAEKEKPRLDVAVRRAKMERYSFSEDSDWVFKAEPGDFDKWTKDTFVEPNAGEYADYDSVTPTTMLGKRISGKLATLPESSTSDDYAKETRRQVEKATPEEVEDYARARWAAFDGAIIEAMEGPNAGTPSVEQQRRRAVFEASVREHYDTLTEQAKKDPTRLHNLDVFADRYWIEEQMDFKLPAPDTHTDPENVEPLF